LSKRWVVGGGIAYPAGSGLRADDEILSFNGHALDPEALEVFLYGLSPDETVTLTIRRNGEVTEIEAHSTALTNGGYFFMYDHGLLMLPYWSMRAI
jgi:hypothetical protein